jgi:hypothetical protein
MYIDIYIYTNNNMLCSIENVPTSTLRELVTTQCNVHPSACSTRKEYIQLLHAHGIFSITNKESQSRYYDEEDEEHTMLYESEEAEHIPRDITFSSSLYEDNQVHFTNINKTNREFEINSRISKRNTYEHNNIQHIRFDPGSKRLSDTALRTMRVMDTLYVRDHVYFKNNNIELLTLIENTLSTINSIYTDLNIVKGNLEAFENNINVFKETVNIYTTNELGEAFPFQIVDKAANVEFEDAYAIFMRESSIITIHMGMRINQLSTSFFAVKLPLPITPSMGVANLRLVLQTNVGVSTIGRVYPSKIDTTWLYVESNLFMDTDGDVCPIYVQIDGTYVTKDMDNIQWITPMRFDTLRYINISPILVSAPTLSYVSGKMQWNRIEERTEVIMNTLFDVRMSQSNKQQTHDLTIELPRLIVNNAIANYKFSGYGSLFLHGSNQYTVAPPEVNVNGIDATNNYHTNIRMRTGTYIGRVSLTTHVIYYQSEDDERTHRFEKPVVHANVYNNDIGVLSVTHLSIHDGYNHVLNTPILQRSYDVTMHAHRRAYTTKYIAAI